MRTFLVTIKLPRRADHDPMNKVTGPCPVNGSPCSDVTGQHHTLMILAADEDELLDDFIGQHITRIEEVPVNSA